QPLGGVVGDHAGRSPLHGQIAVEQLTDEAGAGHRGYITGGLAVAFDQCRALGQLDQVIRGDLGQYLLNRVGGAAGPVAIEVGRYRIDHRPDRQYIQIGKEYTAGGTEVFITDIAAADNGGTVIGGEGLVVHAPVEPRKIGEKADPLGLAYPERIEQAHLDLRML